ncbi:hypothetical protein [Nonomuraea soli]|uniref:Uncharacterized protein n=1 Tax=Nonomuraea soli TaxID=1032476 RepID=A0A7W0HP28_9ACTN|nr:hypothetical protein [Nonomuraea soli]MBA2890186.1 hypothetical protein [Nonomuraea soli]
MDRRKQDDHVPAQPQGPVAARAREVLARLGSHRSPAERRADAEFFLAGVLVLAALIGLAVGRRRRRA